MYRKMHLKFVGGNHRPKKLKGYEETNGKDSEGWIQAARFLH